MTASSTTLKRQAMAGTPQADRLFSDLIMESLQ
jgi:hypothetical protein